MKEKGEVGKKIKKEMMEGEQKAKILERSEMVEEGKR